MAGSLRFPAIRRSRNMRVVQGYPRLLKVPSTTGVLRWIRTTAPCGGLISSENFLSFGRSEFSLDSSPMIFTSYISPGSTSLSLSVFPIPVTVNPPVLAVDASVTDWSTSVYVITVSPGVRSTASPPAALPIWNVISSIASPVVFVLATTAPRTSIVPLASDRPALWISLDLSLAKMPVDSAAKANTDDTTTKAMSTMAVSSPVIPRLSPNRPAGFRPGTDLSLTDPASKINGKYALYPNKPTKILNPSLIDPTVAAAIDGSLEFVKRPGIVTFVVDTSGSMMGGKIDQARDGLIRALDNMARNNQVGLVTFNDTIDTTIPVAPLAENRFAMADAAHEMRAEGGTALYDAIKAGIRMTDDAPGDPNAILGVVVLTDGRANKGRTRLDDLIRMRSPDEKVIRQFTGFENGPAPVTEEGRAFPDRREHQPITRQLRQQRAVFGRLPPPGGRRPEAAEQPRCPFQV